MKVVNISGQICKHFKHRILTARSRGNLFWISPVILYADTFLARSSLPMFAKHSSTSSTLSDETLSSFSSSMTTSRKLCHKINMWSDVFCFKWYHTKSPLPHVRELQHQWATTYYCQRQELFFSLTFTFSSCSRGNVLLNKNFTLFRSSLAISSLILATNTL